MDINDLIPHRRDRIVVAGCIAAMFAWGVILMLQDFGVLHG